MKVLVVSDCSMDNSISQRLEEILIEKLNGSNFDYKYFNVNEAKMNKCIGCFGCWLKTPGKCVFNDLTGEIMKEDVNSDVYIFLNEITYGGYSPKIKRVLDRGIGKILPFFKEVNGELHHAPRYDKYPNLCFVGYGSDISDEEGKDFKELNLANAINLQKDAAETIICKTSDEARSSIDSLFELISEMEGTF